jgi:hypothetical protein
MVQATIVSQTNNVGFVFRARVTAHDHSSFLLNPHQQLSIIFIILAMMGKFGQGDLQLQNQRLFDFHVLKVDADS